MTRSARLIMLSAVTLLGVAGCATAPPPQPVVKTITVDVPVAVPCQPQLGPEPAYPDTAAAVEATPSGQIEQLVQLLLAGRDLRQAWIAEQAAAIKGCSTP